MGHWRKGIVGVESLGEFQRPPLPPLPVMGELSDTAKIERQEVLAGLLAEAGLGPWVCSKAAEIMERHPEWAPENAIRQAIASARIKFGQSKCYSV